MGTHQTGCEIINLLHNHLPVISHIQTEMVGRSLRAAQTSAGAVVERELHRLRFQHQQEIANRLICGESIEGRLRKIIGS